MSTSNFCYDNRCVVVTNEDLRRENYPELGEDIQAASLGLPTCKLVGYKFKFWDIIITEGYYQHACIDYVEKPNSRNVYDYFSTVRYASVRDFCDDVHQVFKNLVSITRIRRIFSGFRRSGKEIYDFIEEKFEVLVEYAAEVERKRVDAAIDKIKADYGYEEYTVYARYSNSETIYTKIA